MSKAQLRKTVHNRVLNSRAVEDVENAIDSLYDTLFVSDDVSSTAQDRHQSSLLSNSLMVESEPVTTGAGSSSIVESRSNAVVDSANDDQLPIAVARISSSLTIGDL